MAYRLGDPTARNAGRLTLNPLSHLDPIGTIAFFFIKFGWAKPVPVNPYNLRNPKKDMLWISAAGPLSNMFLALVSGLFFRLLSDLSTTPGSNSLPGLLVLVLILSMKINLALAIMWASYVLQCKT